VLKRLLASWRREDVAAAVPSQPGPDAPATLRSELGRAAVDVERWWHERRAQPRLYAAPSAAVLDRLRTAHRDRVDRSIDAAERILRHEFDLLGSGRFVPVDPDRPPRDGYMPIDWYLDPIRRLRFPRGVPHKAWKLYEMRPGNADVKYPWELARCQHWATLGQAFQLTADERFAREIAQELDDFVEANPIGIGINWTCTMDVALRAVSWAIGLELVHGSRELDVAFWTRAYSALFDHGVFIRGNLENTYEVTSNHFLSNVVGLWFLGAVFADVPEGVAWTAFARASLEKEIDVQVLADGADFESSVPYHRLVAELFLGSARLAEHRGEPLSAHYRARVRDMVAYLAAVVRPDGLMPQVGDADDGRLHVFGGYGSTSPQDGRHLFGPASAMFTEPRWAALGGEAGAWEAAWWGVGELGIRNFELGIGATRSRLFPDAGIAVMQTGASHYVLVTNGIVGTKGFGNHKHNDQLSFEYHHDGVSLIVDPGSFVYTSDFDARNLFRSTACHNTLCVDGTEQNEMRPEWIFRLFETANAEHVSFDDRADAIEYVGRHHGYERLPDPVTHERVVRLHKATGALEIVDRLHGRGDHELRWHFHLAPGVAAEPVGETTIVLSVHGRRWLLTLSSGLRAAVGPAAYSPSYGVKVPCLAIDATTHASIDGHREWAFAIQS
jgi:Heparinase II/III-like protein/Heparinase II/III N-terminus